ncbi:MAG TPA: FUSC family protein [Acidimicrobiales bacterium]|nr:FUSC family protein [Acidimicrobiales bacterium]
MTSTNVRQPGPTPLAAPAGSPERSRSRWVDLLISSDPGLNRLRGAAQSVLTIAVALAAEWTFVHLTGALQIRRPANASVATAAQVAEANHDLLAIALLLGAIVGLTASAGLQDRTAKGQAITLVILPIPIISALALGIGIGGHRVVALVVIALVLAVGTYLRRFGPRGFLVGQLLFLGYFVGFSLHSVVRIGDLGWLAAEVAVGFAVVTAVRFAVFYPHRGRALERTRRSFDAGARHVTSLALKLFDAVPLEPRRVRRMHRQLIRLNEAALMIDAQLADPAAVPDGSSGELVHQRLFDIELALTNVARFAEAMARQELPGERRSEVRLALLDLAAGDNNGAKAHADALIAQLRMAGRPPSNEDRTAAVVAHRFAGSVIDLCDALTEWMALGNIDAEKGTFQSSVVLLGGWLPGSAQVSSAASLEGGRRWGERAGLARYTRNAIQIGVAAGLAIALGVLISPQRFYWAVLAAFIAFMGAHNAGEQVRKALFRVGGTVIGIGVGSLLVSAIGHHTSWSIAVILVTLFLGLYLFRISYAFLAVAITVTVSQLYQQLGEFTNSLLVVRLEETALGSAIAIAVVILVLPLRTRQVLRVAVRQQVEAIGRLVDHASAGLAGREDGIDSTLRSDARAVDAAYQTVVATAQPVRRTVRGSAADEETLRALRLTAAARNYSRNLVVDAGRSRPLDDATLLDMERASATLHQSIDVVARALTGPRDGTYTRSAALFDRAERSLDGCPYGSASAEFALRDFMLLDGTLAHMAQRMGLPVTDYDTQMSAPSAAAAKVDAAARR